MRTLIFDGKFGHIKEKIHEGLVVFCHFEPEDDLKTVLKVGKKIKSLSKNSLILVPFAHLSEKSASKKLAKVLFEDLVKNCENKDLFVIPFGVEKEFFLYAPAKDSAIKFMRF
jgi:TolB-like protein